MQIEMKRPLFVPAVSGDEAIVWRVIQRMMTPYIDLNTRPADQARPGDVVVESADTLDELLLNWGAALVRCAALDDQPELSEFADVLAQAVQMVLDNVEESENFLTGVSACLSQVYSDDLVVLSTDAGDEQYEVLYRALRGEEEYAVLSPTDGDSDGAILILRCLYPEDGEEPAFEDADETIAEDVYAEFMAEFSEELYGEG